MSATCIYSKCLPTHAKNIAISKIIKCTWPNDIDPNKHIDIPKDIWQYFILQKHQMKKGITLIYNLLESPPTEYKNPNMTKWEKDQSLNFTKEQYFIDY